MTNQEVFDKVATHLLTQNKKSQNEDVNMCSCGHGEEVPIKSYYRANDGSRCAIGCLIPDGLFKPEMEGLRVKSLMIYYKPIAELFAGVDQSMLFDLQLIHDQYKVERWKDGLGALARTYGLNPAVLEKF